MSENTVSNPDSSSSVKRQPHFAWLLVGSGVVLVAAAIIWILWLKPESARAGFPRVGQPMAEFTLAGLDGQPVSLSDFEGQPVLINAWASWCPPCRAEMPDLQAFYDAHHSEGLVLLAVNAGESPAVAGQFIEDNGFHFPVALDPEMRLMDRLQINDFPTSILVGRDGKVKAIHVGLMTPKIIENEIAPHLNQ